MFQSVNPSTNRPKRYQTNTDKKQPGPVVAGCILWPQLTARTLSVGVTQSLHTAERLIDDRLYSAIPRSLEQTHCARMWFNMSD